MHLEIDPENYIACSSLAKIYNKQGNKEKADYYARNGIRSARKQFTPDDIKKKTLAIVNVKDFIIVYPDEYDDNIYITFMIYDLYEVHYSLHKNDIKIIYDKSLLEPILKRYKIELDYNKFFNNKSFRYAIPEMPEGYNGIWMYDLVIDNCYFEDEV